MSIKTFATEEDKNAAIEAFDERTGDENDLNAIMDAVITPDGAATPTGDTSEEPKPDNTLDQVIVPDPLEPEGKTPEIKAETPNSELDVLKKEIEDKNKFIQESLGSLSEINKLREELNSLKQQRTIPVDKPVEPKQSKLDAIMEQRRVLNEKYPTPEDQLSTEYQQENNALQDSLFEELGTLHHNLELVKGTASNAIKKADIHQETIAQETAKKRDEEILNEEVKAMEEFTKDNPEFTLSKPFKVVEENYKNWQRNLAKVYFGREGKTQEDFIEVMDQLNRKSPNLITKLKIAGVPTGPDEDGQKYLGSCEVWDYWKGIRVNPSTGDYNRDENGRITPLTRYEPSTGTRVPDTYPSPQAAFNDKNAKEGYYVKQLLKAKIDGGKQAIDAINKRGNSASELDASSATGGSVENLDYTLKRINEIDEVKAERAARNGDPTLLNELNGLLKAIGV